MSTINERLQTLIDILAGGSQSEFARSIGTSQSTLNTYLIRNSEPRLSMLYKIAVTYPDLSGDWLLTGKGGMFKAKETSQTNTIQGNVGNLAGRDIMVHSLEQENRLLKEQLNDKKYIIELLRMKH